MPYRCRFCEQLTREPTEQTCDKQKEQLCDFRELAVVHLLHKDGIGRVMASSRVRPEFTAGADEPTRKPIKETLKLCCDSAEQQPIASAYLPAVTCLTCLDNFKEKE